MIIIFYHEFMDNIIITFVYCIECLRVVITSINYKKKNSLNFTADKDY